MYSTKTATTNNQEFTSSYMPVGINENVSIKEINVNNVGGKDFLEIVFENEQGQTATMTEWKNEKNMWIKTDEDLQNRDNQQFGRILQVIKCWVPEPEFEGNSFLEMINWVKKLLEERILQAGNHKLRIKVCYNKKGYTRVSNLGIFIEPMSVKQEESQIKLFKNDLMERPVQPDKEDDPLSATAPVTADSTGADDLPF